MRHGESREAEGVGFEPTRPFRVNALAGRRLKPLGHPSKGIPISATESESQLPRQGSNLDSSDPESDVLPMSCIPEGAAGGGETVEKVWHCVLALPATVLE